MSIQQYQADPAILNALGFNANDMTINAGTIQLGGGSPAIGGDVTDGIPQSVLYVDANRKLGQDVDNLTYDPATVHLQVGVSYAAATNESVAGLVIGADTVNGNQASLSLSSSWTDQGEPRFTTRTARGSMAVPVALSVNDPVFTLRMQGFNAGGTFNVVTQTKSVIDAVPVGNSLPGRYSITTQSNDGSPNTLRERVRITSVGAAGVTTPDVNTTVAVAGQLEVQGAVLIKPGTFAALPASPTFGMMQPVNNSNTGVLGAIMDGGGSHEVLAFYNGTNWVVTATDGALELNIDETIVNGIDVENCLLFVRSDGKLTKNQSGLRWEPGTRALIIGEGNIPGGTHPITISQGDDTSGNAALILDNPDDAFVAIRSLHDTEIHALGSLDIYCENVANTNGKNASLAAGNATGAYQGGTLAIRSGSGAFGNGGRIELIGATDIAPGYILATGKLITEAAGSDNASLQIPAGSAPTSPQNGDFWTTTDGAYVQINGGTVGPLTSGSSKVGSPVDLVAQSAAISATTLYTAPADGMYRISYVAKVTQVAGVSSVLGGSTGFQVKYTDPADSVVVTTAAGITASLNTTQAQINGVIVVYAKASTDIQYLMGYTSVPGGGANMQYNLHVKVEAL